MDDRARERIIKAEQIVRDWQAEWLSNIGSPAALAELKWAIAGAISAYGDEREREALERAAKAIEVCTCESGPQWLTVNSRHHRLHCQIFSSTIVRSLIKESK